jgi:hypothetical protein
MQSSFSLLWESAKRQRLRMSFSTSVASYWTGIPAKSLSDATPTPASGNAVRDAPFRHEDWLAFNRGDLTEPDLLARVQLRTGRSLPELTLLLDTLPRTYSYLL